MLCWDLVFVEGIKLLKHNSVYRYMYYMVNFQFYIIICVIWFHLASSIDLDANQCVGFIVMDYQQDVSEPNGPRI